MRVRRRHAPRPLHLVQAPRIRFWKPIPEVVPFHDDDAPEPVNFVPELVRLLPERGALLRRSTACSWKSSRNGTWM